MCFFRPQTDPLRYVWCWSLPQILSSWRAKIIDLYDHYHILAHLFFGYFCPSITKKSKEAHFWSTKLCRSPQKIFSSRLAQKTDQYDHNFGYFCPDMTKKLKKDKLDPKCSFWTQKWCRSLPKICSSWRAQKVDLCDLLSSTCSPLLWIFLPLYRVIWIRWQKVLHDCSG